MATIARSLLFPLGGALLLLAACSADRQPAEVPKQNQLSYVRLAHPLKFRPGAERLDAEEAQRLDAFLAREDVGYGDEVALLLDGDPVKDAAVLDRRRRAVAMALARRGAKLARAEAVPGAASAEEGALHVGRYVVIPPGCPNWYRGPFDAFDNQVASNFGCATATNFGLMLADPGDMTRGRTPGPSDGEGSTLSIQRYRAGQTIPLLDRDSTTQQAK